MAYLMRRQGLSLTDIADELHCSPSAVTSMLNTRFKHEASELSDEDRMNLLSMENERLDYMLAKLWPSIEYGDIKSIMAGLKITELRVKINQLDLPSSTKTQQVLVIGGESTSYVERLKQLADGS